MTTVVFGEALVDDFAHEQIVGGAPFNVARHLAAFMAPQLMVTRIGDDRNGALVRAEFERFAMSERGLQADGMEETGRVIVHRSADGHRFAIQPRQAYDFIAVDAVLASVREVEPTAVYFGALAQRGERSREALFSLLGASTAMRFLDLNLRPGQYDETIVMRSLEAADIVKVNEDELQLLFGWSLGAGAPSPSDADAVRAGCAALVERHRLEALLVTLGHRGSVYFGRDGNLIANRDNPTPPFVIDTAGAGDAFSAIFLLGRSRGWPLAQTLARANEFAGAICAIPGAVPRDMDFYDRWVAHWRAA
ncbi:PfkB family carbohydrate kinase [Massilia cavernae]|uniref:Fructokinase n=1 Tax=Massilia cavernae TaxID=2320864 RepID=A0A418Y5H9_9BURK|nr:PfkB family carbohydrate kinase [Massilia cavernae]RJG21935.1 fructokinase [Massilia cavernae]